MNKRALIIGYNYVDANMGGVRERRIVRLLPRCGWEPVVLTHPAASPATVAPPEGVRVEPVAAPDLTRAYERLRGLTRKNTADGAFRPAQVTAKPIGLSSECNRWLMIPDKQMTWYRPAVRRGRELLGREKFDVIFASLEPRTSLRVGARLAADTGVPCVAEYRDLWTGSPYYHVAQPTAFHRWLHERLESRALVRVKRVSAVCRGIAEYLSRKHASALRAPVALNYNFFDPAEYPAPPGSIGAKAGPFAITYAGAMYASRAPHQFFEGVRAFLDQTGLGPDRFQFRWAGGAAGIRDLGEILDRTGMRPYLDFRGHLPHRDALGLLMEGDAALVIQSPDDTIHIPGKLYEALGARVPVLALCHPCETAEIVTRCRAGIVCPHTASSVAAALAEFVCRRNAGTPWEFNEPEVQRFSAEPSVRRLASLLDEACA